MNWDAVAAVAEVIGALAVVFTLVYLAIQMKHSALAANQSAQQSMVAEMGASMDSLFANPDGAEIWIKGLTSYSSLSAVEKVQLTSLLHHFTRTSEQAHLSFLAGTFDADVWRGLEVQLLEVFSSPGIQEWWSLRGHWYSEAFQSLMNQSNVVSTKYSGTLRDPD